jgi:membrane protein
MAATDLWRDDTSGLAGALVTMIHRYPMPSWLIGLGIGGALGRSRERYAVAHGSQPTNEPSLVQLLGGLVNDASALMRQEWALAKYEVQRELRKVKVVALSLSLGIGITAIGGLLLLIMLVHLLDALTGVPLWGCYGLIGGVLALMGGVLLYKGNAQMGHIHVLPRQTVETLKAHVNWISGKASARQPSGAESPSGREAMRTRASSAHVPKVLHVGGLSAKEFARRMIYKIRHDDCFGRAAELAYYFLFALFPFSLFLTTLLGYLPVPNLTDRLMELLAQMLPSDALRLVQEHVRDLVTGQRGGLLSFGIFAALWTSSSAITAIIEGLNRAYDVEEGRSFWKVRGLAIVLTIGLSLFMILSIVLLTFGTQLGSWIADQVGSGGVFQVVWNILRWPVSSGLLIVAIALVYYVAPDVEQKWQWITPGSVVAVMGWIGASLGFGYYVNHFGSYNATYGSIGAVIVLLTWMYVSGFFILVGGEINAEIEHAAPSGKAPGDKQFPTT